MRVESDTGPKILAPGFFSPTVCNGPATRRRKPAKPSAHSFFQRSFLELGFLMEIFDYDNILLLPRKCRVESRSECDAGVTLGNRKFRLPVVPANMKTVHDVEVDLPVDGAKRLLLRDAPF
jgi:hypothetical protein